MFGGQKLWPLDVIIILIGAFMSGTVFVIAIVSVRALSAAYDKFNHEVKKMVDDQKINVTYTLFLQMSLLELFRYLKSRKPYC